MTQTHPDDNVTPQEIEEVANRKRLCAEQWNPVTFVEKVTKLYDLFETLGWWPSGSVDHGPHQINESLARELGYEETCIELMKKIPYPKPDVRHDWDYWIITATRYLDYRYEDDLRSGRHPDGGVYPDILEDVDGRILPIMATGEAQRMSTVSVDTKIGALYQYILDPGPPSRSVEYRVQRHLDGWPEIETNEDIYPNQYRYALFVPANQFFERFYDQYYTLRVVPFLQPPVENDTEADLELYYDSFLADQTRRKQREIIKIYRDLGWPDLEKFDHKAVAQKWSPIRESFRIVYLEYRDKEMAELEVAWVQSGIANL